MKSDLVKCVIFGVALALCGAILMLQSTDKTSDLWIFGGTFLGFGLGLCPVAIYVLSERNERVAKESFTKVSREDMNA